MPKSYLRDSEVVMEGTEVGGDVAADTVDLGIMSGVNVVGKVVIMPDGALPWPMVVSLVSQANLGLDQGLRRTPHRAWSQQCSCSSLSLWSQSLSSSRHHSATDHGSNMHRIKRL